MTWPSSPGELLSGPRGRRLCLALVDAVSQPRWQDVWLGVTRTGLGGLAGELATELAAAVAAADLAALAATTGELALLPALAEAVGAAMYWQESGAEDEALALPGMSEALLPVAHAVTRAPAARWWAAPMDPERQHYVDWSGDTGDATPLASAAAELAAWRAETLADERSAASRPDDPAASYSGYWWSSPKSSFPATTRALPGLGAAGLALVEDSMGFETGVCWPLRPEPGARVCEITGPRDWAALVAKYPLDVSKSRRHDWWRVTGVAGIWLIPDFMAAAAEYDAVHVSAAGYLTTAGRALPAGGGHTMLAGWNPDETYWLADVAHPAGPATRWATDGEQPPTWSSAEGG